LKSNLKKIGPGFFPPIDVEADGPGPIYRKLYNWFRGEIVSGRLRPGQKVPSTRELVSELKISRSTVLAAYQQLLAEGYLEGAHGSGTYVAKSIPDYLTRYASPNLRPSANGNPGNGPRDFSKLAKELLSYSTPPLNPQFPPGSRAFNCGASALDRFPAATWSRLMARHLNHPKTTLLQYGLAFGYLPCREAIAEYLSVVRGIRCEASQVMIVSGSQHGLEISARSLLDPGDSVWVEEPAYLGGLRPLNAVGARPVPVPVDAEGLDVQEGIKRCPHARAVLITPSHQFPMGATMSASRRMTLLDWAAQNGSWIIEDDYDSEYRFGVRPIAALQGLDTDDRVIYVGTFSKILFPALRIGYLIVPKDLVPVFAQVRRLSDIFPATPLQAVLADFIREGHLALHIRRMRRLYLERHDILVSEIRRQLGRGFEIVTGNAGTHLVMLLPPGIDDQIVCQQAADKGIASLSLSSLCQETPRHRGLVLGYGAVDRQQIREGVSKLAVILQSCVSSKSK
jgi:GntR family transcriptional regulator / MocR family aminotransferase